MDSCIIVAGPFCVVTLLHTPVRYSNRKCLCLSCASIFTSWPKTTRQSVLHWGLSTYASSYIGKG